MLAQSKRNATDVARQSATERGQTKRHRMWPALHPSASLESSYHQDSSSSKDPESSSLRPCIMMMCSKAESRTSAAC